MLFRGYLPIQDGRAMAEFLRRTGVRYQTLKGFLLEHGDTVKVHARQMAREAGRPYVHLRRKTRTEDRARQIERDRSPPSTKSRMG